MLCSLSKPYLQYDKALMHSMCDMGWAGSCIEGYPAHSESMLLTALVRVLVCTVKHKVANAAPTIHVTVVLNSRQDILYAALYKGFLSIRRVT